MVRVNADLKSSWGNDAWRRMASVIDPMLIVAIVLSLAAIGEVLLYLDPTVSPTTRTVTIVLNLVVTVSVALREWHLITVTAVASASTAVLVAFPDGRLTVAALLAELILLFLAARRGPRQILLWLGLPFLFLALPIGPRNYATGVIVFVAVAFALIFGDAQRQRARAEKERDASMLAMRESERERVAIEERTRIARELHDVVAHHLSMIAVQAESASVATPGINDEARQKLGDIAGTARDALTEMRRLLGVLRADGERGAPLEPQPGLERLAKLVDATRETGTRVTLTVSGKAVPLPDGVDLAAYRIAQEALTNTRRHAEGSDVEVDLHYEEDWLHLRVRDHGAGSEPGQVVDGHGLAGMKERASMVGGVLRAAPHPDGGFTVEADLPTAATS